MAGSAAGAAECCAGLALPAEDGRLWHGGKRAGWNRGHDLATGAPLNRAARDGETRRRLAAVALRPGYRAAGVVGGSMRGASRPVYGYGPESGDVAAL